jgi:hypothetical protein
VTLKSIYFAFFHSIMRYGIIFGGSSSNSKMIFTLQKRLVRIMAGAKPRYSCRSPFYEIKIYLNRHCFYSVNEFLMFKNDS